MKNGTTSPGALHGSPNRKATPRHRDGRRQRSQDNQQRIVLAVLELIYAGHLNPSAEQVSERAGVGLRTVFRQFKDMESLRAAVSAVVAKEIAEAAVAPFKSSKPAAQILEMVDRRAAIFERLAPYLRAAAMYRAISPVLQANQSKLAAGLRRLIVERLASMPAANLSRADAIDLLLSPESWLRLRDEQGMSVAEATAILRQLTASALALK